MTETYLWAALVLMHVLGAYVTYSLFAMWLVKTLKPHSPIDFILCLLGWELVALWVIFEKTTPKPPK